MRFCTRCGATSEEPETLQLPYGFDRVCSRCGMGVMLSTPRGALPTAGSAFLVVSREGRIAAVSEAAERLVGSEADLVGAPLTGSLTSENGDEHLVRSVARAAGGRRDVEAARVLARASAAGDMGRMVARIASCGPPRAALLVLERSVLD